MSTIPNKIVSSLFQMKSGKPICNLQLKKRAYVTTPNLAVTGKKPQVGRFWIAKAVIENSKVQERTVFKKTFPADLMGRRGVKVSWMLKRALRELKPELARHLTTKGSFILVSVHHDNKMKRGEALFLTVMRAENIRKYLKRLLKVNEERIRISGNGLNQPLHPNTSSKNRWLNRRIEISVVQLQEVKLPVKQVAKPISKKPKLTIHVLKEVRLAIRIAALEMLIHRGINQVRVKHHLKPLRFDQRLRLIARGHSRDMALNSFFSHYNSRGENPTDRGKRAGYTCRKRLSRGWRIGLGENISQNNLYASASYKYINDVQTGVTYKRNSMDSIARTSIAGWMKSPGHRKNILQHDYTLAGMGIAISSDGKVYITQVFC
ncbi:MAG: CAP domain-containing protein [Pseudomonadota bacterium]